MFETVGASEAIDVEQKESEGEVPLRRLGRQKEKEEDQRGQGRDLRGCLGLRMGLE